MRRLPKALELVEKLNDEASSENSTVTTDGLRATRLENSLLSKAEEHDVLLYLEAAAAHTRVRKQNAGSDSRAFYFSAA